MKLYKLTIDQEPLIQQSPEMAMAVHVVSIEQGNLAFVLSSQVLFIPNEEGISAINEVMQLPWFRAKDATTEQTAAEREEAATKRAVEFKTWKSGLDDAPSFSALSASDLLSMKITPTNPALASSVRMTTKQLQFSSSSSTGDLFYRCEHWPSSIRVGPTSNPQDVLAGTFAFPLSELRFVPTGFAAVGRYALPQLPPACNRYELSPPVGTNFDCGACVPLFGQAGGGVEVFFHTKFLNSVSFPKPTILAPL